MPEGVGTPNLPLAGGALSHVIGNEDVGGGQDATRRRPAAAHAADLAAYIAAAGVRWKFDSNTTTAADPGAGDIRFNNAAFASVTEISISDLNALAGNPNISAWVLAWEPASLLMISKAGAAENYAIFRMTALNDQSGYTRLTVVLVAGNGSFVNGDALTVLQVPSNINAATSRGVAMAIVFG